MAEKPSNLYPQFSVENNKHPNRLYAFPFLGLFVKCILLIPVWFEMVFLGIAFMVMLVITWFVVLFTGKYWDSAYTLFVGMTRLSTKITLFVYGITDKYPGFGLDTNGVFQLDIQKPAHSNRWLAIPFIGIFVRLIVLIPFLIFTEVLQRGSGVAMVVSWFIILFTGRLPESLYEFERDSVRVSIASSMFMVGLSDKYPSFSMSMNHKTVKILLIIAGALLVASNWKSSMRPHDRTQNYQYQYNNQQMQRYPNQNQNQYYQPQQQSAPAY